MALFKQIRIMSVAVVLMAALAATAQTNGDITTRVNTQSKVTVKAPAGLTGRNNSDSKREAASGSKKSEATEATSKSENKEKSQKDGRDEVRPPKRSHTTQQSIQARGVGYRIQAFSDNSGASGKATAQQRARAIAMKFPQYRSYISYNAPSWRLRIGDFQKQEDAQKALQRVRAAFPAYGRELLIVRDRINVWGN